MSGNTYGKLFTVTTAGESHGTAGGAAFEHAGEDFDFVGFLALGGVAAGARLASIQITLQILKGQFQPWLAAINNGDQRRPGHRIPDGCQLYAGRR